MSSCPWKPCKIRVHPGGREVLFEQHETTREIRKGHTDVLHRMAKAERDALPRYFENPKYITRGKAGGGELQRWPQVADVVFCGDLRFGECIEERRDDDRILVRHRDSTESWYGLDELDVVHHNIVGMGEDDPENLLDDCLLGLQTVEEIDFATVETLENTTNYALNLPAEQDLSRELIRDLHDRIFGRLFPWGGEYRVRSDIVVGRESFETEDPANIKPLMVQFESDLQTIRRRVESELDETTVAFWIELARVYFKLCKIHPFRDGNGRVSRLLLLLLIIQGMENPAPLVWDNLSRTQRRTDIAFTKARRTGDLWDLAKLIYLAYRNTAREVNENPTRCDAFDGN